MSDALILIGGPGSGKSSVLDALGTMLEIDDVQFGAIETEQLARGWPWLNPAQWMPQLEAVIELQRRAGRQRFLVAATTETEQELRAVVNAVAAEQVVVVCLSAPADLAARRVAEREPSRPANDLAASAPTAIHQRRRRRSKLNAGVAAVGDSGLYSAEGHRRGTFSPWRRSPQVSSSGSRVAVPSWMESFSTCRATQRWWWPWWNPAEGLRSARFIPRP